MTYRSIEELPESVKGNLPKRAQEIYKETFNSAIDQYGEEETAHKVAWGAVKRSFKKEGDRWVKKGN